MRRSSGGGESNSASQFPFLAVLLCTMGALVVLLISLAEVSRRKAERETAAATQAADAALASRDGADAEREALAAFEEARRVAAQAESLKQRGAEQLSQAQRRLSDVEDHLDAIRDEAESLKAEATELFRLEQEHFDDAEAAEQELERLNRLAGELEEEVEQLKFAAAGRERKYAVVPLRDRTSGTLRPPFYFECRSDGVVLQPEGVRLTWEDLAAPDFSSPVAAASRAVTRYYEENPSARAANEVGAPYPLLIVRPDGVESYYMARTAVEATGVDFGYQPIGGDWPMEYGDSNPVLLKLVSDAVSTAREERRGLAQIVPRLAQQLAGAGPQAPRRGGSGGGSFAGEPGGGVYGSGSGGFPGGVRVTRANPDANNPFEGLRIEGSLPDETATSAFGGGAAGGGTPGAGADAPTLPGGLAGGGLPGEGVSGEGVSGEGVSGGGGAGGPEGGAADGSAPGQPFGTAGRPAGAQLAGVGPTGAQPTSGAAGGQPGGQAPAAANAGGGGSGGSAGGSPGGQEGQQANALTAQVGPPNSAQGSPGGATSGQPGAPQRDGVPMVRPISLFVAADRVVVLPDRAQTPSDGDLAASNAATVAFEGATSARINDVVAALKRHADSWGIAGDGLYWDPRLVLNVSADGVRRADEVRRLLEAAGVKVQAYPVATAAQPSGGSRATR